MPSFARRVAELNGTSAVLHEVSDSKFTITIPQEYDDDDEETDYVCVITVECGQP